jgi:cytochrome c oxidase subunit III
VAESHASAAAVNDQAAATHEQGHVPGLAHHFETLEQQRESAELGMWLFLVTEFMFFGGLFMAYLAYRFNYPEAFDLGSAKMDLVLGTINTLVLLASSLTMALAVHAAHEGKRDAIIRFLLITLALGLVFLLIKSYEYHHKYEEHLIPFGGLPFEYASHEHARGLRTFYNLYFLMTGFHAFHMVIGMVMLGVLAVLARRGDLVGPRSIVVHNVGLYWHFVDLVWVYLFPFFYLITGRLGSGGGH